MKAIGAQNLEAQNLEGNLILTIILTKRAGIALALSLLVRG